MPLVRRARTISVVRLLRRLGPVRRRKVLPRQQQPDQIRREYYLALLPIVHRISSAVLPAAEIVGLLAHEREQEARSEAAMRALRGDVDNKQRALELVRKAGERAAAAFQASEVRKVAEKFGKRTSEFQKQQLDKQTRSAFGVELNTLEPAVTVKLEGFAAENASLIKNVSQRYFERIKGDVLEAFESGTRPETLAQLFVDRDDMSERDAMRIARDQIGKLNGQLNEERQTQMGVTGYIWRTAQDNRVRDEHSEREGEHFEWDDPPEDGHPGEPIQCRCYAEPDLAPLTEGADDLEV